MPVRCPEPPNISPRFVGGLGTRRFSFSKPAVESGSTNPSASFAPYRFDPRAYIIDKLGWTPWVGTDEEPGQQQILDAYVLALRQQHERLAFENGEVEEDALRWWRPGQVIRNWIRVESGHTTGKTKLSSGIVSHFFDCFRSVIYTFAPTSQQIKDLLWKEIRSDRGENGLPGRLLETCEIKTGDPKHFAIGRAAGAGSHTEAVQGQHESYMLFVLDEAEGVRDYVYDAIKSMASGGICIVLLVANPRTRSSRFHKVRKLSDVASFRISCLWHPNVRAGRELVPGAVRREYVLAMIEAHCEVVSRHSEDDLTFEVPFIVNKDDKTYPPGTIFRPDAEMMYRVLGIAPVNLADNTFVPVGRYEAAVRREPVSDRPTEAWIGVDCAGYGLDFGTIYARHDGAVWREATLSKGGANQDPTDYWQAVRKVAFSLRDRGVRSLKVRFDAGGGYGNGLHDLLKRDAELKAAFAVFEVHAVHFGGTPHKPDAYRNLVTEMYAEAGETVKGISIPSPPECLEADLTERIYQLVNFEGRWVYELEKKDDFRKRQTPKRSPDDGDGFVLCVAPDFLFKRRSFGAS